VNFNFRVYAILGFRVKRFGFYRGFKWILVGLGVS